MITKSEVKVFAGQKILVLEIPLDEMRLSSTGRSYVLGGTGGKFQQVFVENGHSQELAVMVNVVTKK